MRNRGHSKIFEEIQKWMDEPVIKIGKGYEVYGYLKYDCFLIPREIKVKITIQNHQCWRHTPKEVLYKFSNAFYGKYDHDLVFTVAQQHLRDDLLDEDVINLNRVALIKKEFLKLSKEHRLHILERIHSFFFFPSVGFQKPSEFEYKRIR